MEMSKVGGKYFILMVDTVGIEKKKKNFKV